MSGTERDDVETLADWLGAQVESSNVVDPSDEQTTWIEVQVDDLADRLIASDWLAQHDAAVAAKARAEALREAADAALLDRWSGWKWVAEAVATWLRDRADDIESEGRR